MLRKIDVKLQIKKTVFQVVSWVFGLGKYKIEKAFRFFGYKPNLLWKNLSNKKKTAFLDFLAFYNNLQLQELVKKRKNLLISINSFRGSRIKTGLPTRGQRTKTNRKTAKKLNR